MARAKKPSKSIRRKTALPVLGAAGASLAMAGGASASAVPTENLPSHGAALPPVVVLGEEEMSDVSLGTFYVFDQEDQGMLGVKLAARGGCRGCGGGGRCAAARCGGGGRCAVARCGGARCAVARCGGRCAVARCARCRCGVGVVGCARCGCTCSGCSAPCWRWSGVGWVFVC